MFSLLPVSVFPNLKQVVLVGSDQDFLKGGASKKTLVRCICGLKDKGPNTGFYDIR